jgi:hypothetical protein
MDKKWKPSSKITTSPSNHLLENQPEKFERWKNFLSGRLREAERAKSCTMEIGFGLAR